jgi:hypothetical protein
MIRKYFDNAPENSVEYYNRIHSFILNEFCAESFDSKQGMIYHIHPQDREDKAATLFRLGNNYQVCSESYTKIREIFIFLKSNVIKGLEEVTEEAFSGVA